MRGLKHLKWCAACANELPLSAFAPDERLAGGYAHVCRLCASLLALQRLWSRRAVQLHHITARRAPNPKR